MLNEFEETFAVTEMHTFKQEPFLVGAEGAYISGICYHENP